MTDKRYLVFGQYDCGSHFFSLPIIDSFDSEEEAYELFNNCVEKRYDWVTLYDRVEGIILKEY
jgi:hypothetical protein